MATRPYTLSTEDDSSLRALLAELLEGEGYRVTFAPPRSTREIAVLSPYLIPLASRNHAA